MLGEKQDRQAHRQTHKVKVRYRDTERGGKEEVHFV